MNTHASASRTITAQNQFTSPITVTNACATLLAMATAMTATILIQIRPPRDVGDVPWADDDTGWVDTTGTLTAADVVTALRLGGSWQVRAGCKTGGFTSATALKIFLQASVV